MPAYFTIWYPRLDRLGGTCESDRTAPNTCLESRGSTRRNLEAHTLPSWGAVFLVELTHARCRSASIPASITGAHLSRVRTAA